MKRLAFGTRYIVAARGLHDAEGAPIAPSPLFLALRDQLPTDLPQLEALRPAYEELFADLEAAGVARDELVLAWDFTTTSQQSLISDAAAIMPQVKAAAEGGALGYTIDSVVDQDGPVGRVIRGTFKAPNCMTGDAAPGSLLRRDAMGKPECSGTVDAPFVIAVPEAVLNGVESAPAAVYGHGLLGSGDEAVSVAALTGSVILVGTDWWGMAEEDIPNVASVLLDNFANSYSLPERLLQSVVNFTTLAYLLHGELAEDQALYADKIKLIDTAAPVNYIGGSQGGIMGGTTVALAPNLDRGVLVVGGANYSLMVWRSTSFAAVNDLWEGQPARRARSRVPLRPLPVRLRSLGSSHLQRADPRRPAPRKRAEAAPPYRSDRRQPGPQHRHRGDGPQLRHAHARRRDLPRLRRTHPRRADRRPRPPPSRHQKGSPAAQAEHPRRQRQRRPRRLRRRHRRPEDHPSLPREGRAHQHVRGRLRPRLSGSPCET
ncbi:MAG: hypothetical protein IPK80_29425 [Nannocystis sp.]|nr:hypothetical protein [Nannocystis sp.]